MASGDRKGLTFALLVALVMVVILVIMRKRRRKSEVGRYQVLRQVRDNFMKLNPEYGKIPLFVGDESYTDDKELITLCVRDPKSGRGYDMNTIMYVALHELAHVLTPEGFEEHGKEFRENFAKLLRVGEKKGIYNPRIPIPSNYCKT